MYLLFMQYSYILSLPNFHQAKSSGLTLCSAWCIHIPLHFFSIGCIIQVPHWVTYDFPPKVREKLRDQWGGDWRGQAQKWLVFDLILCLISYFIHMQFGCLACGVRCSQNLRSYIQFNLLSQDKIRLVITNRETDFKLLNC